jgi:hypothetical protein
MKTCFDCLHFKEFPDSIFVQCKSIKRVPYYNFEKHLKESEKIEKLENGEVSCKYWREQHE